MKTPRLLQYLAYPQKITGPIIEAELRDVAIGELCEIRRGWHKNRLLHVRRWLAYSGNAPC